jgi:hypothetical protein
MSRAAKHRRQEVVNQYLREIESEYDVEIEFDYAAKGDIDGRPRSRCTCLAIPLPWTSIQGGYWAATCEIIQTAHGASELRAHLEVLSRIRLDLQMSRSYGLRESLYWVAVAT